MVRTTRRCDAVAGLAAAVMTAGLLVSGPGLAVAVGDPGPRHSHSRDGGPDRDGSATRGDGPGRGGAGGPERTRDARPRGGDGTAGRDGPADGGSSADGGSLADGDLHADRGSPPPIIDVEPALQPSAGRPSAPTLAPQASAASPAPAFAPQAIAVAPSPEPVTAPARHGSGRALQAAVVAPATPRVVFGNGRTPGSGSAASPPATSPIDVAPVEAAPVRVVPPPQVATPPAVVPPAPSATPNALADRRPARPSTPPLLAPPTAGGGGIGPLWGLAGLILAPIAGTILGYRQARANKAAAQLKSALAGP